MNPVITSLGELHYATHMFANTCNSDVGGAAEGSAVVDEIPEPQSYAAYHIDVHA